MNPQINLQLFFVSLPIAIITAFITALLNNYYWKRQLRDEEKLEYRKLYNKKKLEKNEELVNHISAIALGYLAFEVAKIEARKQKAFSELMEKIKIAITFLLSNSFYIKPENIQYFSALGSLIIHVAEKPDSNDPTTESIKKLIKESIPRILVIIQKELEISGILHSQQIKNILKISANINQKEKEQK